MSMFAKLSDTPLWKRVSAFLFLKQPTVLIVHKASGAATSSDEPVQVELEHITPIDKINTLIELPAIPKELDREVIPMANLNKETVLLLPAVSSFKDSSLELTLEELCIRAINKYMHKHGFLPTYVIVNSMRLLTERPSDLWDTFDVPGYSSVKLRGMKNCPSNMARCAVAEEAMVA